MRYLIIGLGIYGTNLARDLTDLGNEVIGADVRSTNVEAIKDYISTAYTIDSTDPAALAVLPLKNVDLVIVAIGENFGASVKTVAQLRRMGVRRIFARAIDELHKSILEGMEVERILNPEQRAAHDLVNELEWGARVETMRLDSSTYIVKCRAPEYFLQMKYADVPDSLHGLTLIAAIRPVDKVNILGIRRPAEEMLDYKNNPDERVAAGDIFVLAGSERDYKALFRTFS
ncbi:MAG: TrkA family potassium uptake protein [Muribaculaceae bacterium]|nr:TrkA family potassium uptake protein [Muribaculaceae bacterium]